MVAFFPLSPQRERVRVRGQSLFVLYLVLGVLVVAIFFALAKGLIVWSIAAYLTAGVVLLLILLRRPPLEEWPEGMYSVGWRILIVLIWPLTFYSVAYGDLFIRRPRRFYVLCEDLQALCEDSDPLKSLMEPEPSFAKWEDAVAFARNKARERNSEVTIVDRLRYEKKPWDRAYRYVMYTVLPAGHIFTFRSGREPEKIA
jgi:hypothetical protein